MSENSDAGRGVPTPILSVVIPAYNGEKWIRDQLEALARQNTAISWEVIVADNGSSDDTRRVVEERISTFPVPMRVVDASRKRGVAFACNTGVAAAHGQYIAICACDDRVSDGWVDVAVRGLEHYDFVCGPIQPFVDGEPIRPELMRVPPKVSFGVLMPGGNMAGSRSIYLKIGGLDEALPGYGAEDPEFSIRVNESGARIGVLDDMILYFRPTPAGMRAISKIYRTGIAEVEVWRRHPARFEDQIGLRRAIGRFVMTPIDIWRIRPARSAIRAVLVRFAHVMAQVFVRRK